MLRMDRTVMSFTLRCNVRIGAVRVLDVPMLALAGSQAFLPFPNVVLRVAEPVAPNADRFLARRHVFETAPVHRESVSWRPPIKSFPNSPFRILPLCHRQVRLASTQIPVNLTERKAPCQPPYYITSALPKVAFLQIRRIQRDRKTGQGEFRSTYSVVEPRTISTMRLWPYAPIKSRSQSCAFRYPTIASWACPGRSSKLTVAG